jgi:hypothetical protein
MHKNSNRNSAFLAQNQTRPVNAGGHAALAGRRLEQTYIDNVSFTWDAG